MPDLLVSSDLNVKKTCHTSSQCRASTTVNVAEREEFYEESENEECFIRPEDVLDEEEDDQEEAYSYVVRRLMLTTPKKSEDTQRRKNFRTRCRINLDLVNVIIDGVVVRISSHEISLVDSN